MFPKNSLLLHSLIFELNILLHAEMFELLASLLAAKDKNGNDGGLRRLSASDDRKTTTGQRRVLPMSPLQHRKISIIVFHGVFPNIVDSFIT